MTSLLDWSTLALAVAAWIGLVPLAVALTIRLIKAHRRRKSRKWWDTAIPTVALSVAATIAAIVALKKGD